MMEGKRLVPKRRFRGFNNEWFKDIFYQLLDESDGIRRGPFGSALKKDLFVKKSDYVIYEQQNAIYDNYNYRYHITKEKYEELIKFVLNEGDFIMSGAGTIGSISRVPKGIKPGVINQALIRIRINEEKTDPEYFLQWVRSSTMQKRLKEANPASAMENLIPMSELKEWNIVIPNLQEQQKIGEFFKVLDERIAIQERKIAKVKALKSAYLTEMFPQEGETVPKRRFKGFSGKWKLKTLSSVCSDISDGDWIENEHINNSGKYRIIQTGNIGVGKFLNRERFAKYINQKSFDTLKANEVFPGDILISRLADPAGRSIIAPNVNKKMVTAVDVTIIRGNDCFDEYFLVTQMNSENILSKINENVSGTSHKRISRKNLERTLINIPEDITEQQKIGEFFKNLDDQITTEEKKLQKLKKMKEAYLEEMFV